MRGRHTRRRSRRLTGVVAAAAITASVATGIAALQGTAVAEGTIQGEGVPGAMDGSYVVVLKERASALEARGIEDTARDMATKFRGRVKYRYSSAVRGFSVDMTAKQARRLAADPRVSFVQQNRRFKVSETQANPPSPGLDRIDQRSRPLDKAYNFAAPASNVTAYIIDTGIRVTHQDFAGRAVSGIDTVDNDGNADDCNGHGTHVAGTIGGKTFGVAKGIKLVGVRVLDCEGGGNAATVLAGIDFVTKNAVKPAVANMSLGGNIDPALDNAIRGSIASGVTYTLAAGNENTNACNTSPARTPEAITVGAVDSSDARAAFSNFGTCLDLFAPGTGITSAGIDGDIGTSTLSGTSMASPHVAGAAALFLATNPNATPQQVRDGLVNNATTGQVTSGGGGSPDRLLFTGAPDGSQPPATTTAPAQPPAPGQPGSPNPGPSLPIPTPTIPTPTAPPSAEAPSTQPGSKPAPSPACGTFSQANNTAIPNPGTTISELNVVGCAGNASARTRVDVHLKHPYRGDVTIDLVAPDGTVYKLKRPNSRDTSADIDGFALINASSEAKSGVWKLRVSDSFRGDAGIIDSWSITV